MRERILDGALRLLAAAGPAELLGFIGPKRAAAAAGASVGGLYHHWREGAPAFAADLVRRTRQASADAFTRAMAEAEGFDDLAARLVVAVRAAPGAAGLELVAPQAGAVAPAMAQLLERAGRTPRPPWTVDRISTLLAALAVGVVAVEQEPDALLNDAVRVVLLSTSATEDDPRAFNVALAALDQTTPALPRSTGWSVADRIPGVRLGLARRPPVASPSEPRPPPEDPPA